MRTGVTAGLRPASDTRKLAGGLIHLNFCALLEPKFILQLALWHFIALMNGMYDCSNQLSAFQTKIIKNLTT